MTARALLTSILSIIFLVAAAVAAEEPLPTATVLCYHIVESPQDPRMEVSRETFRQHIRYLERTGYNIIPLRDLYDFVTGKKASIPKNAVVITIDDGWRSTYTEVFPEMKRRNFPFTVFVYPKIIGQTSHALSWKQIKEMSDAGVDIQSHSLSHPFLTHKRHSTLDDKQYAAWLETELAESKRILETQTGRNVAFIAYPYGDYDHRVAATAAKAGYSAALTCDFGRVKKGSDPLRMKRVVIDKRMDFAAFRRYLGAGSMKLEDVTPLPGHEVEPNQPVIVTAKISGHQQLDPKSVGMTLLSITGQASPFSYDPQNGAISMTIKDVKDALAAKTKYLRALVWGTEQKSGKRVEASIVFKLPEPPAPPVVEPVAVPKVVTPPPAGEPTNATVAAPSQASGPQQQTVPPASVAATRRSGM